MAKLTLAVAALVAISLAGARVQAQAEQQMATFDQPVVAQDAQVPVAVETQAPMAEIAQAPAVEDVQAPVVEDVQAPVVEDVQAPVVEDVQAPVVEDVQAPVVELAQVSIAEEAPTPAAADVVAPVGPSMDAASLSPRLNHHAASKANAMRRPSRGSGVGLMIFGGAALITGLIIGNNAGTVIAVGGAIVGLYGLYVYLGRPTGMEHSSRIGLGYKLNTN